MSSMAANTLSANPSRTRILHKKGEKYESEAVKTPAGYGGDTLIRVGFNL